MTPSENKPEEQATVAEVPTALLSGAVGDELAPIARPDESLNASAAAAAAMAPAVAGPRAMPMCGRSEWDLERPVSDFDYPLAKGCNGSRCDTSGHRTPRDAPSRRQLGRLKPKRAGALLALPSVALENVTDQFSRLNVG